MKTVLMLSIASLVTSISLAQSTKDKGKIVAICGDYALVQGENVSTFNGIIHKENSYWLISKNSQERQMMKINLNSEGAILTATEITDYNPNTGAAIKYFKHKISAMWKSFYMVSTNESGTEFKSNCSKQSK